jgi:hypothetical protein
MCRRVRVMRFLIVAASFACLLGTQHEALAQLGPTIPRAERERVVRIFHLRHANADSLAGAIRTAFVQDDSTLQLAVEERTNSLIVYGITEDLEAVKAVIAELDAPVQRAMEDRDGAGEQAIHERLLFYWLATGPDFKTDEPIPEQLQPVVKELQRLGLDDVQLVSRSLAAFNGDRVSIETTVDVAERTYSLEFEGAFDNDDESAPGDFSTHERLRWRSGLAPRSLTIRVTAAEQTGASAGFGRGRERSKSCSLATQITTPRNHFVVLGVTGLGDLENAFVIQIQANEPAKDGDDSDISRSQE